MQNNYEVRAQKFIQQIFPFIEDIMEDFYEIEDAVDTFNETYHRKVSMRYGDARVALITSDYVVKFTYDYEAEEEIGGGENEIALYEQAVKDGFEYLFAKVSRYEYMGKYFYIMPKIDHIGERKNLWNHADDFMTPEEQNWCEDHFLIDLHSSNFGFRGGKVCIVDYAYIADHDENYEEEY